MKSIIDYTNKLKDFFAQKQALSNEVETRSALGAHNLLTYPYKETTTTKSPVTFTVNNDWSVTVSWDSTPSTEKPFYFKYTDSDVYLDAGTYIVSGKPAATGFYMHVYKNSISEANRLAGFIDGAEHSFTLTERARIIIGISVGTNAASTGNYTVKPMIRLATDADTTYRPYVPTNSQLLSYKDNGVLGAHNFLPNELKSQVSGNITFQANADGTTTITGSIASGDGSPNFAVCTDVLLKAGTYVFSGIPDNIQAGYGYIQAYIFTTSGTDLSWVDRGSDKTYAVKTLTQDTHIKVTLTIYQAHAQTFNFTYKPMIRLVSDSDSTYQPYAMTNRELTENKADKSDLASINITGTTNSTGATITIGTYFYLNGQLVKAKTDIAANAAFTLNTNYEVVTAGALNTKIGTFIPATGVTAEFSIKQVGNIVTINGYGKMTISDSTGADWNNLGAVSGVSLPPSVYGIPRVLCGIAVNPWEIPLQVGYATIDRTTGELLFKTTQTGLKSIIFNITYAV